MALVTLGSSSIKVDLNKVNAKTPIEKDYVRDIWGFKVLVDGIWIDLEYTTLASAEADYNALT